MTDIETKLFSTVSDTLKHLKENSAENLLRIEKLRDELDKVLNPRWLPWGRAVVNAFILKTEEERVDDMFRRFLDCQKWQRLLDKVSRDLVEAFLIGKARACPDWYKSSMEPMEIEFLEIFLEDSSPAALDRLQEGLFKAQSRLVYGYRRKLERHEEQHEKADKTIRVRESQQEQKEAHIRRVEDELQRTKSEHVEAGETIRALESQQEQKEAHIRRVEDELQRTKMFSQALLDIALDSSANPDEIRSRIEILRATSSLSHGQDAEEF